MKFEDITGNSYAALIRSSDWLRKIPFESHLKTYDSFCQRLIQERNLFHSYYAETAPLISFVIFGPERNEEFMDSLESCLLQSALGFNLFVICDRPDYLRDLKEAIEQRLLQDENNGRMFHNRIFYAPSLVKAFESGAPLGEYIVGLCSGDLIHPSLATLCCLEIWNEKSPPDIIYWNEIIVKKGNSYQVKAILRKPEKEFYTLLHFNYISYDFAFKKSLLSGWEKFDEHFCENQCHLFLLDQMKNSECRFQVIPQFLFLKDRSHLRNNAMAVRGFLPQYRELLDKIGFDFKQISGKHFYMAIPRTDSMSVSVVIPFRDQVELTCRAVRSVLDQDFKGSIEIILINNRSRIESIETIQDRLRPLMERCRIVILEYNRPFNHSAQCNLGVDSSTGETLVFINNDAYFVSPDALRLMTGWAALPSVGTVGVRMIDGRNGMLTCAGLVARELAMDEVESFVEESHDIDLSEFNRECWGNTFACAAISRSRWERLGALDTVNFPIGYNDVDYCIRGRRAGLRHIYLGSIIAVHSPMTSRTRSDESYQVIKLRRLYPSVGMEGIFQLRIKGDMESPVRRAFSKRTTPVRQFLRFRELQRSLGFRVALAKAARHCIRRIPLPLLRF